MLIDNCIAKVVTKSLEGLFFHEPKGVYLDCISMNSIECTQQLPASEDNSLELISVGLLAPLGAKRRREEDEEGEDEEMEEDEDDDLDDDDDEEDDFEDEEEMGEGFEDDDLEDEDIFYEEDEEE